MSRISLAVVPLLMLLLAGPPLLAAGDESPDGSEAAAPDLAELVKRISRLEAEVERLTAASGQPTAATEPRNLFALIETPTLGRFYQRSGATRYFVGKLVLVNTSGKQVRIRREGIRLTVDGDERQLEELPARLRSHSVQLGTTHIRLGSLDLARGLLVPAGGSASTWLVFPDLSDRIEVPRMVLTLVADELKKTIDINEQQRAVLSLKQEMIGPQDTLALLTIEGTLNGINVQTLVDELDGLAAKKIGRVVLHWTESAPAPEPQLLNWLVQSAVQAPTGRPTTSNLYPPLPVTIRELHLAALPKGARSNPYSGPEELVRVHENAAEAVSAALDSAYRSLPRQELLKEIREGHVLARAAALENGGGRLGADQLPELLRYADDGEPLVQQAALSALRHFGEPAAIEKLLQYARGGVPQLADAAIESLAGSRFTAAHDALLELLANEPPEGKKQIVQVLARYPRPIWSDTIYEYVRDTRAGLHVAAVRALVRVGHPQLVDVLEDALRSDDPALRAEAFPILVGRADERSEQIALEYTLEQLKNSPPDNHMVNLLGRTKDARAIPLLISHLDRSDNKAVVINLLAQIGDRDVADVLIEKYPGLQSYEKGAVLNALQTLRSPRFREMAAEALLVPDSSMVSAAAQGLQRDGGPEAVQTLIEAYEKASNNTAWSYISNALSQLGTAEARKALIMARESSDENKQRYAMHALNNMRQRSPAYQYVYQAQVNLQQKNEKEALEQFEMAIQIDPDLPEAYAGRANILLKDEKIDEAGRDFAKAFELDPYNSLAATGLAIVSVLQGKPAEGVQLVEKSRKRFDDDVLFAYNSACVYGRAVEALLEQEAGEERDKQLAAYRREALAELKRSLELGFNDVEWMKEDPDLGSLHDLDEFQKIVETAPAGDDE